MKADEKNAASHSAGSNLRINERPYSPDGSERNNDTYSQFDQRDDRPANVMSNAKNKDDLLREKLKNALHGATRLDPSEIQVTVKAGHVRLTGKVPLIRDKTLAEEIVESIEGVVDVTNQLEANSYFLD